MLELVSEVGACYTLISLNLYNAFLRYKYLMQFMCDNAPAAAGEIRAVYIESMGRTISALFRAYHAQLVKLEIETANRQDLIAIEVSETLETQRLEALN